jgi:hypothetical protein
MAISNNNHTNQLNPGSKEYLDSRGCNLTEDDVSKIQSVEAKSKGEQTTQGLGAEAQRRLNIIKNDKCHLKYKKEI